MMKYGYTALLLLSCLTTVQVAVASTQPLYTRFPSINDKEPSEDQLLFARKSSIAADTGLITQDSLIRLISNQFSFAEGPAADKAGNVYFTDQPNNKIWKYGIDEQLTVFMDSAGRSNGLYFDRKGNLIACADENNQLWSISADKKVRVLANNFRGRRLNGPNDVWVSPRGDIYFTDPYYERPYWTKRSMEQDDQRVYCIRGSRAPTVAADSFVKPNGIIGSPDGKSLFIADIGGSKIYQYRIAKDGTLTDRKVFTAQGCDGMTIDNRGNIYLAGNGVTIFNPDGKQIGHIDIPAKWTGNVCFGGKDRNKLFITASEAVYVLDMQVRAAE